MLPILIVDDEPRIRDLIREHLQYAGFTCEEAGDGTAALSVLSQGGIDLVILDIMMPELDGLSATRAIRGMDGPDAQLPIIAMTASLYGEDVAACLAAGMDAHIPKPLEAGQMIRTIAEWLERKKQ